LLVFQKDDCLTSTPLKGEGECYFTRNPMRLSGKFFLILLLASAASAKPGPDLAQWVNPFIGTSGGGNTFPGALVPWGMVSVSPHNDLSAPSGYYYGKPFLYGFGHVHLSGTGCPDLGSVLLLPTTGDINPDPEKNKSAYDKEAASPGYYRVTLKTYDIQAEMTASTRVGLSLYTFPARKGDANILINVSHRLTGDPVTVKTQFDAHVKLVSNREAEGFTQSGDFCSVYAGNKQTVYFVIQFSKPSVSAGTWRGGEVKGDREQSGRDIGAFFRFSTASSEPIEAKVGVSYVSVENARQNLNTEMPEWDFETVRSKARGGWNQELSKIELTGVLEERMKIFYTALYHALIHPSVFSDVNGQFQTMGHHGVDTAETYKYTRYHVFSLWDTYRNLHPFLGLFYPLVQLDMTRSIVEMAKESDGFLPKWELAGNETGVMVGAPAVPVILDTYRQGLKNFDTASAYDSIQKTLNPHDNKIYGGLKSLLQLGYIPKNDDSGDYLWGSVSTSLEYSYDYWCLAQMAKDLKDKDNYEKFIHLSGVYRNFYDPATGFLRAKNRDGTWMTPFDPLAKCCDQSWPDNGGPGYVEGNAWNYLFFAPQDIEGLKVLMGGDGMFADRLQECFDKGHYDPTNEPDLAYPYLFDYVPGEAWRTQKEVRAIMDKNYGTGPNGIPGNDDAGTMSAWYLFSALGFYPACPGSNEYQIGSPIYKQATIHLDKEIYPGGLLILKTIDNSVDHPFVQSVLVDGIQQKHMFFKHDTLVYGKTILFRMGPNPSR